MPSTKYFTVKQGIDDGDDNMPESSDVQLRANMQSVRKAKHRTHFFALLATVSIIWNLFFLLRGQAKLSASDIVPQMPFKEVVFNENPIFGSPPSNESNQAWDDLFPPGRGFVYVQDAANKGLVPGDLLESGEACSVSVLHQIHCLGMLRMKYWTLLDQVANKDSDIESWAIMHRHNSHANHCFDYLRQSLQCAGDMALEWPLSESGGRRKTVDGWGIPH